MSLWSHTRSTAIARQALVHPSSRPQRILFCNHFHSCRTLLPEAVLPTSKVNVGPSIHSTKRHIATASPTMPPRNRKRASAQVDAQDDQSTHAAAIPHSPESASSGPRRSSRRIPPSRDSPLTKDNLAGNAKKRGHNNEMDANERSSTPIRPAENVARRLEKNDEDAAAALRRLEEMEASFKNDIKRRRLQIEQTIMNGKGSSRSAPTLKLRGSNASGKSDVVHLDHVLLTPEEEKDVPCETAKDNESEADDELMQTIKGANRPPAVNSDYLPLPWRGRLGYVSSLTSKGGNSAEVLTSHLGLPEYLSTHRQAPCL